MTRENRATKARKPNDTDRLNWVLEVGNEVVIVAAGYEASPADGYVGHGRTARQAIDDAIRANQGASRGK